MSNTIQNDIVESIAAVIHNETDTEIKKSPFIAVQVDDTSDISNKCQLTVIARYVNDKGTVCERFLGFYDVSSDRDANAIASVALKAIENYNPTEKLICQTYDGASCMSGQHGGVQALVKSQCPNALFIHCYAHKLNLVLAQGTKNIQAAKLFFASVDAFHSFFSRSCKRSALLRDVDRAVSVPGGSAVRWNFKSRAVHAIHEGRGSLIVAFGRIMVEPGWDRETIVLSAALKQRLEDFDFCFLLGVFQIIFGLTEPLFQVLQNRTVDIKKCQERIRGTLSAIKSLHTDEKFSGVYDDTVQVVGEPALRRKRRRRGWDDLDHGLNQHQAPDEETVVSFRRLHFEIIDAPVDQDIPIL
ncbi:hypothetical protein ACEWY4_010462 [Coilia grayii]|uniref:DUF4371 domain-containing protein n=1 Tax=Coilia grayii TaxID=363190 RepID=A0ABD1K213_9TELE